MIAITRFTEVLGCIRKRLSHPDLDIALSDDTIMAVIDSICYSVGLLPCLGPLKLNLWSVCIRRLDSGTVSS